MESAIRLCYCPLQRYPLNVSKGLIANANANANASSSSSKLFFHHQQQHHTLFNHACLCASHFPTLKPTVVANNRFSVPSNNSQESETVTATYDDNNKVLRGVTGISLVLACVVGLINFNSKINPMFKTAYAHPLGLPGGKEAVESLLEAFSTLPNPDQTAPKIKNEPSAAEVKKIKSYAVGLSKSGEKYRDNAEKILKKYCEENKGKSAAHDLKMVLVEVLIIQGKYEKARTELNQIIKDFIVTECTDHKKWIDTLMETREDNKLLSSQIDKMIFYKFFIHTMLDAKEEAKEWLDSFRKILEDSNSS